MSTLEDIDRRIRDCKTYNFGMTNADRLAHVDAPKVLAALQVVEERLTWLDAIQEGDNNTPKNANAGGVASFIRAGINEALEGAA